MRSTQTARHALEGTFVNELDGKVVSRQMVRPGLMAQARHGAGGSTLVTAGA